MSACAKWERGMSQEGLPIKLMLTVIEMCAAGSFINYVLLESSVWIASTYMYRAPGQCNLSDTFAKMWTVLPSGLPVFPEWVSALD